MVRRSRRAEAGKYWFSTGQAPGKSREQNNGDDGGEETISYDTIDTPIGAAWISFDLWGLVTKRDRKFGL
ncbi:hypothetical protein FHS85_005323 [Rhodoligotrophos appendicifer]